MSDGDVDRKLLAGNLGDFLQQSEIAIVISKGGLAFSARLFDVLLFAASPPFSPFVLDNTVQHQNLQHDFKMLFLLQYFTV
jgi:hypothetical protein